jgi:hypothetical protein
MAGSDLASPRPGDNSANPAFLAGVASPGFFADIGRATRYDGNAVQGSVFAPAEDLGLGLGASSRAYGGSRETRMRAALGLPVVEVPGLALGASFHALFAGVAGVAGRGSALDLSLVAPIPVPAVRARLAVAGEDLFGWLRWADGGREDLPSHLRVGASVAYGLATVTGGYRSISGAGSSEGIWSAGTEFGFRLVGVPFALRAGLGDGTMRGPSGTAGVGVRAGGISLDYAVAREREGLGTVHSVGAGWMFGEGFRLPVGLGQGRRGRGPPEVAPASPVFAPKSASQWARLRIFVPPGEPVSGWSVMVVAADGSVVWQEGGEGAPPSDLRWAGATREGLPVPDGEYIVRLMLRRGEAPVYLSTGSRLAVEHAFAQPRSVPAPAKPKEPEPAPVVPEPKAPEPVAPLAITAFTAEPATLVPGGGRKVELRYEVNRPCELTLVIGGPRSRITRPVDPATAEFLSGADGWDGLDTSGKPSAPGAYRATLKASTATESVTRTVEFRIAKVASVKPVAKPAARANAKTAKPKSAVRRKTTGR